jgi:hypothetical protein
MWVTTSKLTGENSNNDRKGVECSSFFHDEKQQVKLDFPPVFP